MPRQSLETDRQYKTENFKNIGTNTQMTHIQNLNVTKNQNSKCLKKTELTVCFKLAIVIFSPLPKTLKIIQKFAGPTPITKIGVFLHVGQEKR